MGVVEYEEEEYLFILNESGFISAEYSSSVDSFGECKAAMLR